MGRCLHSTYKISSSKVVYLSLHVNSTPRVEALARSYRRPGEDG
jgi:hypothetical protein